MTTSSKELAQQAFNEAQEGEKGFEQIIAELTAVGGAAALLELALIGWGPFHIAYDAQIAYASHSDATNSGLWAVYKVICHEESEEGIVALYENYRTPDELKFDLEKYFREFIEHCDGFDASEWDDDDEDDEDYEV